MAECRGPRFGDKGFLCCRGHLGDVFSNPVWIASPDVYELIPLTEVDSDFGAILGPN